MKDKQKAQLNKVLLIILIVLLVVGIIVIALNIAGKKEVETMYESLENENLLTLEACSIQTDDIAELYSISTEEEKQAAYKNVKMQTTYKQKWFNNVIVDDVTRSAEIIKVMYAMPEKEPIMTAESVMKYLVIVQVHEENSSIKYLIVTYVDKEIANIVEMN
jgi:hypothetical protein